MLESLQGLMNGFGIATTAQNLFYCLIGAIVGLVLGVVMLADELQKRVKPDGLAMVMEADHFCMQWRGVKDTDSKMMNSVMRGSFLKDADLRREFLSLLGR